MDKQLARIIRTANLKTSSTEPNEKLEPNFYIAPTRFRRLGASLFQGRRPGRSASLISQINQMDLFQDVLWIIAMLLFIGYIIAAWPTKKPKQPVTTMSLDELKKQIATPIAQATDEQFDRFVEKVFRELSPLQHQAEHNAKVTLLILQHLGLEHQIQPTKDVLVKVDNKQNKERSA